jgi:hypothetical protein
MTNEEIIEELLYDAEKLRIREQVISLASKIKESSPKMTMLDALELSFEHLKNS